MRKYTRAVPFTLQHISSYLVFLLFTSTLVSAQQQCYFGPGAINRGPSNLVPCLGDGYSTCCLIGDICLSGNACYNYNSGNLYQYGCTDIKYEDASCPQKCGFSTDLSPWTAMEFCTDLEGVNNTWVCHAPESCGCDWGQPTYDLLELAPRGCKAMGSDARVALYAPVSLAPYVSLPTTVGGSTGYYSPTTIDGTSTWISTPISGYTPDTITQLTTYRGQPTTPVELQPGVTPAPSTVPGPSRDGSGSSNAQTWSNYSTFQSFTNSPTSASSSGRDVASSPTGLTAAQSVESSSGTSTGAAAATSTAATMSTGAKIGIGVGVSGGVIGLAAVGLLFYMWHRRQYQRRQPSGQSTQAGADSSDQHGVFYDSHDQSRGEKVQYYQNTWSSPPQSDAATLASSPPYGHAAPYYGAPALLGQGGTPYDDMAHNQHQQDYFNPSPAELGAEHRVFEVSSDLDTERNSTASPRPVASPRMTASPKPTGTPRSAGTPRPAGSPGPAMQSTEDPRN